MACLRTRLGSTQVRTLHLSGSKISVCASRIVQSACNLFLDNEPFWAYAARMIRTITSDSPSGYFCECMSTQNLFTAVSRMDIWNHDTTAVLPDT